MTPELDADPDEALPLAPREETKYPLSRRECAGLRERLPAPARRLCGVPIWLVAIGLIPRLVAW